MYIYATYNCLICMDVYVITMYLLLTSIYCVFILYIMYYMTHIYYYVYITY